MSATQQDPAAAPAESAWRSRAPALVLALILVVAAALRFWSLGHGLPYAYNLDERAHFVPHAVAMTSGDLNPGYFINPPALTYLLAAWLSVIHLGGVEQWFADDPGAVFLWSRVIAVAFGVGAVAATYAAGREWFGRRAGLVAAAIMAVAFLPVFYSRLALNDGPGVLPCALALWASAIVLRTGSTKALLAGGACVGLAASLKYSDGAIVIALVAAALLSPALSFKQAFKGLVYAGLIAIAAVIVTNPYLFADWSTFTHDLDRQRKFASGAALLGQPERNGWVYYVTSSAWALGIVPGVLAVAGGVLLLVKGRRREAIVFGALIVLYFLYMGSQSRFYARWMLPLYPALAILAAYAMAQIRQRAVFGAVVALALIPSAYTTIRNAIVLGREDTRIADPRLAGAQHPAGHEGGLRAGRAERVVRRDRGRRAEGRPGAPVGPLHAQLGRHRELAREFRGARYPASFQNYQRTLWPGMLDVYRREGYCWIVTGSTQYGRARPSRTACRRRCATTGRCASRPTWPSARARWATGTCRATRSTSPSTTSTGLTNGPGPEMIVYKLRDCT